MYMAYYIFNSIFDKIVETHAYRHSEISKILPIANGFGSYVIINEFSKMIARSATYTGI